MRKNQPTLAIALILCAYFLFAVVDTFTKLVSTELPQVQSVWARYLVQSFLMIAIFAPKYGKKIFITNQVALNVIRGTVAIGSSLGFIYGATYLPLPVVTAVQFSNPLIVCALSAIFLSEKVGIRRFIAIIVGLIGVGIVLRPEAEFHLIGIIGAITTAVSLSIFAVMTRALAGKTPAYTQQTFSSLIPLILMSPFAILVWDNDVDLWIWLSILAMGFFAWAGYYLLVLAHENAPAVTLAPFVYTLLIWVGLLSWIFFDEPPDIWVIIGSSIIILSGLYIWLRERQLHEQEEDAEKQN